MTHSQRIMDRSYLSRGLERFVVYDSGRSSSLSEHSVVSSLESFCALGQNSDYEFGTARKSIIAPAAALKSANLLITENVFPFSEPALAERSHELMLLYVADNGNSNGPQFTDVKWTRFDGTNWSTPAVILADTRAEFAPQVRFDGNGDAIAVWERVADPNFSTVDLSAMASRFEIVWSRWDRASKIWTTPPALTTNSYLDHAPLLSGPVTNGNLLLVWTKSPNRLVLDSVEPRGNSQVLWSQWNAASRSWTEAQIAVTNIAGRFSQTLAGAGKRAIYAWTQIPEDAPTNSVATHVFYSDWTEGYWSSPVQHTFDHANANVRAAMSPQGNVYVAWQQGTNLLMDVDLSSSSHLVRSDPQTIGFADYAMTLGPAGTLALIWQGMTTNGCNAHFAIYDPMSDTWSNDALLFQDATLKRSFAPTWDQHGNLTVAYNRVEIVKTNVAVKLDDGATIGYYTVFADETAVAPESNRKNNTTDFSVYLLVDSNDNGLPDDWELQHFGRIGVDPAGDPDGDRLSNIYVDTSATNAGPYFYRIKVE